jgi:hypothetical protein
MFVKHIIKRVHDQTSHRQVHRTHRYTGHTGTPDTQVHRTHTHRYTGHTGTPDTQVHRTHRYTGHTGTPDTHTLRQHTATYPIYKVRRLKE